MMFNTYFYKDICTALDMKTDYDEHMKYVCNHLREISPNDNNWYFNGSFIQVDVLYDDINPYLEFIEDLVGCKYCHLNNGCSVTLMISLSTLKEVLDEQKEVIGLEI